MNRFFRGLLSSVFDDYYETPSFLKGNTQKQYKNKNANIEYYTDEKGNIRRRKIKWKMMKR